MASKRRVFTCVIPTFLTCLSLAPTAQAGPWTDVGTANRPSWVFVGAERRLRLLAALPGIESSVSSQANAYFGTKGPGMSVGLVLDDGLYYSQGFGFADAAKSKTPDENTVFRAGSLSKVMTGTALLTLIDDPTKNMSLDDNADKQGFLPELKFVCPAFNQNCARGSQNLGIKLKHLVSHTAGLADVMEQTNAGVQAWLGDLKKSWLLFPPGTLASYSGVGVEGVGLIGSRVSGKSYPDFVKANLFTPLGMTHSSMDPLSISASGQAQKWQFSATNTSWSFAQFNSMIGGDDQAMILPAGGLATSVRDLSLFMRMWLSGNAPDLNGHPMLKTSTIQSATTSMFSSTTGPGSNPCANKNGSKDSNGFFYSTCGAAFGFGVTWWVGTSPYIQHNGDEPGVSGSNTVIDQSHKIAATGLVSTEPYPGHKPQQPSGLDPNFITTVTQGMLNSGTSADSATTWAGQTLADGVARVLWLSGKTPAQSDLDAFKQDFIQAHNLTGANIVSFLNNWHSTVGKCQTFRVRGVSSANKIDVRFQCDVKKDWDVALTVGTGNQHRISWNDGGSTSGGNTGSSTGGSSSHACKTACNTEEGHCMMQAHGSGDKQACVQEKKVCLKECGI